MAADKCKQRAAITLCAMLMPMPGSHAKRYTVELAPAVHTDECSVLSTEAIGTRRIRDRIGRACDRHSCDSSTSTLASLMADTVSRKTRTDTGGPLGDSDNWIHSSFITTRTGNGSVLYVFLRA